MTKFDFQTDESAANEKRKEDGFTAYVDIVSAIKYARTQNYLLTLGEIAQAVQEGVGDDTATLGGLLLVIGKKEDALAQVKAYEAATLKMVEDGVKKALK